MTRPLGYSLVELLFVLLIAGILLSLATPALVSTVQDNRETQAVNQLLGALHYARGTAVMERKVVGICGGRSACNRSNHWHGQLMVYEDSPGGGGPASDDSLLRVTPLPGDLYVHWRGFRPSHSVIYKPDGTVAGTNGTLTLCRDGIAVRALVINVSGRVRTRTPSDDDRCNLSATRR